MAQALLDLSYYKCGHCSETFDSLSAFGKHQKEKHKPQNAPQRKQERAEGPGKQKLETQGKQKLETPGKQKLQKPGKQKLEKSKDSKKPRLQFVLKLKLCGSCANTIAFCGSTKLEISLCTCCLKENGLV